MSENKEYWVSKGQKELTEALTLRPNEGVAQNVIIFIGDGMGISTITAARIFKGQMNGQKGEDTQLYFESFPYVALSKVRIEKKSLNSQKFHFVFQIYF